MNTFWIILAACPVLLLGAVAFVVFIAVSVRKGDKGKRLTEEPGNAVEAFARRILTGSRDLGARDESGD
jgi:hypothetical protein